ncbi:MAG: glutamine-hydrolyzing carbamoyl-phosphate synthase small subunit [bacterium]|nr:glutamine-hydrolyzing carbamoyl-phosphate synthase small subunit [bacterium]
MLIKSKKDKALLVLKDGTVFSGYSFGFPGEASGEVVFNTSMMGYQEILTDPSYKGQIVTMTYPMIGNYGVNPVDVESAKPQVEGFIVKEYSETFSNFRASGPLSDYLFRYRIVGIEGIDTRALVRHIRDAGAMPGLIAAGDFNINRLKKKARELPSMEGQDLVQAVTCSKPYGWDQGSSDPRLEVEKTSETPEPKRKVVAYDFGVKRNILRHLVDQGCEVLVVPAQTSAEEILELNPDGVFLSNGPGDPAAVTYAIENVSQLAGKIPLFGICLGHQILGLSQGAKTFKLKFGHRGGNQPIKNLETGHVEIASHNHGFAITKDSVTDAGELTHLNLNDDTVAGFKNENKKFFAVQYHPEASPGPHDSLYLFKQFRKLMDQNA